jgi:hypothetical protein
MRMPPCLPHAPLLQFRIGGLLGLTGYRPTLAIKTGICHSTRSVPTGFDHLSGALRGLSPWVVHDGVHKHQSTKRGGLL